MARIKTNTTRIEELEKMYADAQAEYNKAREEAALDSKEAKLEELEKQMYAALGNNNTLTYNHLYMQTLMLKNEIATFENNYRQSISKGFTDEDVITAWGAALDDYNSKMVAAADKADALAAELVKAYNDVLKIREDSIETRYRYINILDDNKNSSVLDYVKEMNSLNSLISKYSNPNTYMGDLWKR